MKSVVCCVAALCITVSLLAGSAWAEANDAAVKAALMFHFFRFIDWPQKAQALPDISVCTIGQDNVADALDGVLRGKAVQGKKLVVRKVGKGETDHCAILYLAKSEQEHVGALVKGVKEGTLTVGESKNLLSSGGMINFISGEKVAFEINLGAAEKAGFKVNAQLLRLAKSVQR